MPGARSIGPMWGARGLGCASLRGKVTVASSQLRVHQVGRSLDPHSYGSVCAARGVRSSIDPGPIEPVLKKTVIHQWVSEGCPRIEEVARRPGNSFRIAESLSSAIVPIRESGLAEDVVVGQTSAWVISRGSVRSVRRRPARRTIPICARRYRARNACHRASSCRRASTASLVIACMQAAMALACASVKPLLHKPVVGIGCDGAEVWWAGAMAVTPGDRRSGRKRPTPSPRAQAHLRGRGRRGTVIRPRPRPA